MGHISEVTVSQLIKHTSHQSVMTCSMRHLVDNYVLVLMVLSATFHFPS